MIENMTRTSMLLLLILGCSNAASEESGLSDPFTITSVQYRSSASGGFTRYPDCEDCMLIEGGYATGCGDGFVIKAATTGDEEAKFLKTLVMLAYTSGKQVRLGQLHCIKWNDAWRGHVNRVYIAE